MADVVDLSRPLETIQGFPPLRRVLLATAGTLQGTLSAYFGAPVTVEVRSQRVDAGGATVHRVVDLVCKERRLVACRADALVHVEDPRMRELIVEGSIGLGQIAVLLGVRTTFELDEVGEDDGHFWRRYRLWGDGFEYRITERFDQDLYPRD
jgi:chorismate-pyruvate lyase